MSFSVGDVFKSYGPVVALRDAAFTVEPGEVRALFGGNGSGKSTLAKIVAGAIKPDAGFLRIDGHEVPFGSPAAAHEAGVAITFQELSLLPDLTVAENLTLERTPRIGGLFLARALVRKQARELLDRLGIAHLEDLPVHALQVGEKYLVELAKALRLRPRYLVLDELTSALHEHEALIVRRVLREHQQGGGGAIVVSHRSREIHDLCDTITVLRNGSVVADRRVADVSADDLLTWVGGTPVPDSDSSGQADREKARISSIASRPVRVELTDVTIEAGVPPLSLEVRQGEILGLGGLPDQGQVLVQHCLFGLREIRLPGSLRLDGAPLKLQSSTDAVRAGIAYVAGDRDEVGFAIRSIQENLYASLVNCRPAPRLPAAAFKAALAKLMTIYAGLTAPLNSLSGGNQQKVLLARCFMLQPKVLIAADPTKGIDIAASAEVHASIRRLAREQGTAVIFCSSDDRELAGLCDRVLVMEKRSIIGELHAGRNLDEQRLIHSYMRGAGERIGFQKECAL